MKSHKAKIPTLALSLALTAVPLAHAGLTEEFNAETAIYYNDFEEDPIGADTSTDPSGIRGLRPAFPGAVIRGDETASPFGGDNQFMEFADTNSRVPIHVTAVAPSQYLEPVMVAFDIVEPNGFGGRTVIGVGSGLYVPEVNFSSEIMAIQIDNGFLSGGLRSSNVFGSLPAIQLDQAYRVFMLMNMSDTAVDFQDPAANASSLGSKEMEVWVYNYTSKEYLFGGRWSSTQDNIQDTIGFVFRHFSADDNKLYIDELLVDNSFHFAVRASEDGPVVTEWQGYAVDENGYADTGAWMGMAYVSEAPWIYSYALEAWSYIPDESATATGGWLYIPSASSVQN